MNTKSHLKRENRTSFLKNVLMLMFSQVAVKALGLLYRVVIVDVENFGNVGNGYYATGYQIYMILLAISSLGIPNVMSKLVSERVAKGDYKSAHRVFKLSLYLFGSFGAFLGILLFFGAEFISVQFLRAEGVKYTLKVLAPALAIVPVSAVLRGYFAGLGSMKANSTSQVIEQFFNCVLSIGFVYACVGKDTAIMAAAGNLSTSCACVIALFYLILFYKKRRGDILYECSAQESLSNSETDRRLIKTILALCIPITLSSLISTAAATIDTVTVSNCIQSALSSTISDAALLEEKAMELYGVLQKCETLTHLPLAISATLCTAIVPVIASSIAKKDDAEAKKKISLAALISSLVIFPCTGGFIALSSPILKLLYPSVPDGGLVFILLSSVLPLAAFTQLLNGVFYGIGKQAIPAVALGIGSVIKLLLNLWLMAIPSLNIYGAVIGTIAYHIVTFIIQIVFVIRYMKIKFNLVKNVLKPLFAAVVMAAVVYGCYQAISLISGNTIATLSSIFVGALVYLVVLLLIRTLDEEDMQGLPMGNKILSLLKKGRLI